MTAPVLASLGGRREHQPALADGAGIRVERVRLEDGTEVVIRASELSERPYKGRALGLEREHK